jgi:hypothetical protein
MANLAPGLSAEGLQRAERRVGWPIRLGGLLLGLSVLTAHHPFSAQSERSAGVLEIRTYTLKPGTRERFHQLFEGRSLPLLRRWNIDVVTYGPSLHDANSYVLMRAFSTLAERDRVEQRFYDSPEWRVGLRAAVLADIEVYTTVVIRADAPTLRSLRRPASPGNDSSGLR